MLLCVVLLHLVVSIGGCSHPSAVPLDNTPALIKHKEFAAAAAAAPNFTKEVLATIVMLEREIALAAPFGVKEPTTAATAAGAAGSTAAPEQK
ncbi:MAG: hypothetical protein LBT00_13290 [Spirochaetaceae bacterium]|nr:hypothetical protein [Spirochaetaceae bacterium]